MVMALKEMPFGMKFRLAETFTLFVIEILHQNTQRMKLSLQSPSLLSRNREEREREREGNSHALPPFTTAEGNSLNGELGSSPKSILVNIQFVLMFQFVTISCVEIICSTKIQTNMNLSCRFGAPDRCVQCRLFLTFI